MSYEYLERLDNVYVIDTHMFGFPHFNAAYIVAGREVALIDPGAPLPVPCSKAFWPRNWRKSWWRAAAACMTT